jgi:hypothetical protein
MTNETDTLLIAPAAAGATAADAAGTTSDSAAAAGGGSTVVAAAAGSDSAERPPLLSAEDTDVTMEPSVVDASGLVSAEESSPHAAQESQSVAPGSVSAKCPPHVEEDVPMDQQPTSEVAVSAIGSPPSPSASKLHCASVPPLSAQLCEREVLRAKRSSSCSSASIDAGPLAVQPVDGEALGVTAIDNAQQSQQTQPVQQQKQMVNILETVTSRATAADAATDADAARAPAGAPAGTTAVATYAAAAGASMAASNSTPQDEDSAAGSSSRGEDELSRMSTDASSLSGLQGQFSIQASLAASPSVAAGAAAAAAPAAAVPEDSVELVRAMSAELAQVKLFSPFPAQLLPSTPVQPFIEPFQRVLLVHSDLEDSRSSQRESHRTPTGGVLPFSPVPAMLFGGAPAGRDNAFLALLLADVTSGVISPGDAPIDAQRLQQIGQLKQQLIALPRDPLRGVVAPAAQPMQSEIAQHYRNMSVMLVASCTPRMASGLLTFSLRSFHRLLLCQGAVSCEGVVWAWCAKQRRRLFACSR